MLSALLALAMVFTLCTTAFAAEKNPAAGDFCIDGVTVTVTYKEKEFHRTSTIEGQAFYFYLHP